MAGAIIPAALGVAGYGGYQQLQQQKKAEALTEQKRAALNSFYNTRGYQNAPMRGAELFGGGSISARPGQKLRVPESLAERQVRDIDPNAAFGGMVERMNRPGFTGKVGENELAYQDGRLVARGLPKQQDPRGLVTLEGPNGQTRTFREGDPGIDTYIGRGYVEAGKAPKREEPSPLGPGVDIPAGYRPAIGPDGRPTGGVEPIPGYQTRDPRENFDMAAKLRSEFENTNKTFKEVRDSFARVVSVASDPSAAGDLALIFNYMKMLDPGSAVRETEFANAQNAGGVPDVIRAQWNKIRKGERLSENQRTDFLKRAGDLYRSQENFYNETVNRYTGLAQDASLPTNQVVTDLTAGLPTSYQPAPPPQAGGTAMARPNSRAAVGTPAAMTRPQAHNPLTGETIEWDGTQWVPVR